MQQICVVTVGMDMGRTNARRCIALQYNGTRTITKQNTGVSIGPVNDAREGFSANHQRGFCHASTHELISDGQGVNKAGTNRLNIKRRTTMNIQATL